MELKFKVINQIEAHATVVKAIPEKGNRVYQLQLDKPIGKIAAIQLSLADHQELKPYFFDLMEDNVIVNAHHCKDFNGLPSAADVYYVWQPRMPGTPTACPRCKIRIDFTATKHL
jgi:hypothetical protein